MIDSGDTAIGMMNVGLEMKIMVMALKVIRAIWGDDGGDTGSKDYKGDTD